MEIKRQVIRPDPVIKQAAIRLGIKRAGTRREECKGILRGTLLVDVVEIQAGIHLKTILSRVTRQIALAIPVRSEERRNKTRKRLGVSTVPEISPHDNDWWTMEKSFYKLRPHTNY